MREPSYAWSEDSASPAAYCLPVERSRSAQRADEVRELRRQEREESKQRTREALLLAGLDAFVELGLDASVAEICGRAGYSRGAFYAHFNDRQDFVVAITEWILSAMTDAFLADETAPNGLAMATERFAQSLSTAEWPLMSRLPVAAVRLMDALSRWPELRKAFAHSTTASIEKIRKTVETGQAAGSVRADLDSQAVGTMFIVASLGAILFRNVGIPVDYHRQAETLLRLMSPAAANAKKRSSRAS